MATENNISELRVASFSCYLQPIEGVANMSANERFTDKAKPSIVTAQTPSVGSETRSYSNNRRVLLNRNSSSDKKWFHGCKGACSSEKSVYVQQSIKRGNQFTFPVMVNPTMEVEVFGSGAINKGDIAKTILRNMSILNWDAVPKSMESVVRDDMASEASSDLFELENVLSTGWQPSESRFLRPSTQYMPSEASIEWSVYSGHTKKQTFYNTRAKIKVAPPKKSQKKLENGLLGCNGFISVKVVEPVYRKT